MAEGFHRDGETYVARLDDNERAILVDLMAQTYAVVAPPERETTGDAFTDLVAQLGEAPDPQEVSERDPVLRRLLPDGHRDDPTAAQEFRSATERSLRDRKAGNLRVAMAALEGSSDDVRLTRDQALATMLALADVRLALAERLGIVDEQASDELTREVEALQGPPTDPRLVGGIYYDFLTWLQEGLALALIPS